MSNISKEVQEDLFQIFRDANAALDELFHVVTKLEGENAMNIITKFSDRLCDEQAAKEEEEKEEENGKENS